MYAVKNNTGRPFSGRYDGIDYPFPPGEEVMITKEAARHIFGLGDADKTAVLVRHGWMKGSGEREAAMSMLNGFSFSDTKLVPAAEVVEAEDETEHESSPHAEGEGGAPVSDGADEPPKPSEAEKPQKQAKGGIVSGLMRGKK